MILFKKEIINPIKYQLYFSPNSILTEVLVSINVDGSFSIK